MDVREKLVELITNSPQLDVLDWTTGWEEAANYLIVNGVTVQEWISVKDMPLEEYEYKTVLYYDGKNVDPCLVLNGKFIDIYTDCGRYIDGVTHLMPLPKPPKGE